MLGYANLYGYLSDPFYLGAVAGPYANRLSDAQIHINKAYALKKRRSKPTPRGGQKALSDSF